MGSLIKELFYALVILRSVIYYVVILNPFVTTCGIVFEINDQTKVPYMKTIILALTAAFISLIFSPNAFAQVRVGVNINIGSQPEWGPRGYDYVEYYYLPDIEVYYFVPRHQFVYFSGGNWVFSAHLPSAYRHYDLYGGYKVVINEPRAYHYYHTHKVKYAKYKGHHGKRYKNGHGHGHGRNRHHG